ncbi:hypothetical protein BOX15_Mlig000900g3 [Macrostomum lignano]|uniref:acylglycerol lipase n=1 Tax=Macrostomum lignano TaxID=282301 RepID=A0A267DKJ5_9PLAT|nr:hypothetical protein BOX15_Mlig000900g3 [Macrostomum lignano]
MAARVSPADVTAEPSPPPPLPRTRRELRSGRLLALCHLKPPAPAPGASTSASRSSSPCTRRIAFLFHGVGGSVDVFRHQVPLLLRLGFEVVAQDLLGHGASGTSSNPDDFSFTALRRDAVRLFDELAAPDGDNILLGHSYGTSFVTYLCHERSRMVTLAIQLAGGGPNALGNEPGSVFSCCTCFFVCAGPALRWLVRRRLFRPHGPASGSDRRLAFGVGAREFKMTMNGQCWALGDEIYHAELRTPTLLLHGEFDRLIPLEDQQWMQQTLGGPSQLVTVPNAGHMLMLEQPAAVNAHIAEFIASVAGAGSATAAASVSAAADATAELSQSRPPPPPKSMKSRRNGSVKSLPCGSQLLRY